MTPPPAGYSGTPLWKKLGFKPGLRVSVVNEPMEYANLLGELPDGVTFVGGRGKVDLVHFFATDRTDLEHRLPKLMLRIPPAGVIWVSWPKKAAKVPTDMTEDVIRDVALPMGLVDVKVCAVDAKWSGLKFVIRKELRG